MGDAARSLKSAGDIAEARRLFHPLSLGIIAAASSFQPSGLTSAFEVYCPMAFDNEGGTWIQAGTTVDNAYYGATMRTCGELKATVEPHQHLPVEADRGSPG